MTTDTQRALFELKSAVKMAARLLSQDNTPNRVEIASGLLTTFGEIAALFAASPISAGQIYATDLNLQVAVDRIKDMLACDDGQAFKEDRKFVERYEQQIAAPQDVSVKDQEQLAVEIPTLPPARGVSRDAESPGLKSVLVSFDRLLTDDELRGLHDLLAHSSPFASPVLTQPSEKDDGERAFNAKRLRYVANLLGLKDAVPDDDQILLGCLGSVLGIMARKIERLQKLVSTEQQASDQEKDAERWKTMRELLSLEDDFEDTLVEVLNKVFPENEERGPTHDELDAVIDAFAVEIKKIKGD